MTSFGRDHLFLWQCLVTEPVKINTPLWFVIVVIGVFILWAITARLTRRMKFGQPVHA
jgi:hypothetical protein